MNKKIKAIHIHTDYKFVNNSYIFDGDTYDNNTIILQNNEPFVGGFKYKPVLLKTTLSDINKAINICKNSDIVVIYGLDPIKCRIALALPDNIKIAWRFFGYELYIKRIDTFISDLSIIRKRSIIKSFLKYIFAPFKRIAFILKFKDHPKQLWLKAILRINYMIVLSREEYDLLKIYWKKLPEFIQHPHYYIDGSISLSDNKQKYINKPIIVLGNNGSIFNNHISTIEIIEKQPNAYKYSYLLLFNYCVNKTYYNTVKKIIMNKSYYNIIENFISFKEFKNYYQKVSALVINSYRQIGTHNIFLAIEHGVKIYLNKKNIVLQWLKNENFIIFSMDDFEKDICSGNIQLDNSTAKHNLERLKEFSNKYTKEDFQKILLNKINNNND